MGYFLLIFELYFVYIAIVDFITIFMRSDKLTVRRESLHKILQNYRWLGIVAFVCTIFILYNNFLFMNFIGQYRLDAMPEGTYYCYVETSNSMGEAIYPCEAYKISYGDEPGSYYKLSKIYINGKTIDVYEEDLQVFTDHFNNQYKLANKKYDKINDVFDNPTRAICFESIDLFIAICCLYVVFIALKRCTHK